MLYLINFYFLINSSTAKLENYDSLQPRVLKLLKTFNVVQNFDKTNLGNNLKQYDLFSL